MDSEHRHELKTNELAEWIEHFPEFCKKNTRQIIGALLIIAAVISYFFFKSSGQQADIEQQVATTNQILTVSQDKINIINSLISGKPVSGDALVKSATALKNAAGEAKEPHYAALALIKRGEALRTELHYTAGDVDKALVDSQIKLAKEAYSNALLKAEGNSSLTAMAKYGLALCEEEIGDFAKATDIFTEIAHNTNFKGTIFPAKAQFRLDVMADHAKKFKFVVAPIPDKYKGFDKAAIDAILRGDIVIGDKTPGKDETKKATPPVKEPVVTPEPEVTPEPVVTPEPEKVYDVGPKLQPDADSETK
jgi:hypothetical protein